MQSTCSWGFYHKSTEKYLLLGFLRKTPRAENYGFFEFSKFRFFEKNPLFFSKFCHGLKRPNFYNVHGAGEKIQSQIGAVQLPGQQPEQRSLSATRTVNSNENRRKQQFMKLEFKKLILEAYSNFKITKSFYSLFSLKTRIELEQNRRKQQHPKF